MNDGDLVEVPTGVERDGTNGRVGILPDNRVQITVPCPQQGCTGFLVAVCDVPRYSDLIAGIARCPLCGRYHTVKYTVGSMSIQVEWS